MRGIVLDILNGKPVQWPEEISGQQTLIDFCREEGVTGLVYFNLQSREGRAGWPEGLRRRLVGWAAGAERVREVIDRELVGIVQALERQGVTPLLFKGCALAHSIYPEPWIRLGCDSDLLIRREDRTAGIETLRRLGFAQPTGVTGEMVMNQAGFYKEADGVTVAIDLHWELSQAQVLVGLLTYEELLGRGKGILLDAEGTTTSSRKPGYRFETGEGDEPKAPDPRAPERVTAQVFGGIDSLLLACLHRAREQRKDRLIWLYDIHLLAEGLTDFELDQFVALADEKKVRALCLDGLEAARACFGTRLPGQLLEALRFGDPYRAEPSARLLRESGRSDRFLTDFRAVPGWRSKLRLAREHLLPPADYLLVKYRKKNRLWIPLLVVRRVWEGVWKFL